MLGAAIRCRACAPPSPPPRRQTQTTFIFVPVHPTRTAEPRPARRRSTTRRQPTVVAYYSYTTLYTFYSVHVYLYALLAFPCNSGATAAAAATEQSLSRTRSRLTVAVRLAPPRPSRRFSKFCNFCFSDYRYLFSRNTANGDFFFLYASIIHYKSLLVQTNIVACLFLRARAFCLLYRRAFS